MEKMNAIFIEGRRTGYTTEQCGRTFTAGELIELLQNFDPEMPVYLINDKGYTYGEITEYTICEGNIDGEGVMFDGF